MIKAVALDLDGTLLNDEKKISKENKRVLTSLKEKGYEIIVATGRAYSATKPIVKDLDMPIDIICYNGAKIVNIENDELIYEKPLEESIVKKLISLSHEKNIHLNLYQNEIWYVEDDLNWETNYYSISIGLKAVKRDFLTFEDYKMTKALYISDRETLEKLALELRTLFGDNIYMAFSHDKYLEVLHKDVNKGKSLEKVLKIKNIKLEECVAFGDAENDIEMLKSVGYGVAMGNADEKIKKIAKYITDTNTNDGVSKFLKTVLNEK